LLVGSHDNFRRLSRELVDRAAEGAAEDSQAWRQRVLLWFLMWQRAMGGHESYEEGKLYPYLARRYGTTLAELVDDHHQLHGLRDEVVEALDGGTNHEALDALVRYDAVLCDHLEREENRVIPMLLELEPEEFTRYTRSHIDTLLRDLPSCARD
jgi:hemerythrin superfamily protein